MNGSRALIRGATLTLAGLLLTAAATPEPVYQSSPPRRTAVERDWGPWLGPFRQQLVPVLMQALASGAVTEEHITGELGQLILGRTPGRESADEITFFDSTGTAALDLVTAKRIYDRAQALHLGDSIEL